MLHHNFLPAFLLSFFASFCNLLIYLYYFKLIPFNFILFYLYNTLNKGHIYLFLPQNSFTKIQDINFTSLNVFMHSLDLEPLQGALGMREEFTLRGQFRLIYNLACFQTVGGRSETSLFDCQKSFILNQEAFPVDV